MYKIDSDDRLGSGVQVSTSFQKNPRRVGRLGLGVRVDQCHFSNFRFNSRVNVPGECPKWGGNWKLSGGNCPEGAMSGRGGEGK